MSAASSSRVTVRNAWNVRKLKADRAFRIQPQDGLVSIALKSILRPRIWLIVFRKTVPWILKNICKKWEYEGSNKRVRSIVRRAMDGHILLMTAILVGTYCAIYYQASSPNAGMASKIACAICVLITVYRLLEIASIYAELHLNGEYHSEAPIRAVLNTFWHYVEVVLAFGTFYVGASVASCDPFHSCCQSIRDDAFAPLYFSFVTITTLGYGDYSPQKWLGQTLVCLEVLIGLLLVVVMIQRALSSAQSKKLR